MVKSSNAKIIKSECIRALWQIQLGQKKEPRELHKQDKIKVDAI